MKTLHSVRLTLRPFLPVDSEDVQRLAGDPEVAATTLTIPHPYPKGAAAVWIGTHEDLQKSGEAFIFALEETSSKNLVGCISLDVSISNRRAMLGYWVGKEYWNQGYCTEAVKKVIQFGFEELNLQKIFAYHMSNNSSSGKVMLKAGMLKEGYFKRHVVKNGISEDCVYYGIVKD